MYKFDHCNLVQALATQESISVGYGENINDADDFDDNNLLAIRKNDDQ